MYLANLKNRLLKRRKEKSLEELGIRFIRKNQKGQSTTEYILILAIVVMISMKFRTIFVGWVERLTGNVGEQIEKGIDSSDNF